MPFGESFPQLLTAAREGSPWAWHALYDELAPPLLAYFRAGRAEDPEDMLGEVFLHVVRDLGSFHGGEAQFRAWAFTIAYHRLSDERRRRARRPVAERAEPPETAGGDVVEEALARLGDERVRSALERLPGDQRNVLLLRLIGDLTVDQVGRATGKTPGAVKALQRRALDALRREISRLNVTF